ncbi:MAG: LarC family nickel insertion protein [Spirochaetota bacterium]
MNNSHGNENSNHNIIYVDSFAGCAGDMLLGALFDMGLPFDNWKKEITKLNINGFDINISEKMESSIKGTKFDVILKDTGGNTKTKEHHHRGFTEIAKLINSSTLSDNIKKDSISIFKTLAEAEAKVHNTSPDEIHFHEVGAIDSIIDIVGFCIAKDMMEIDEIFSSPFHLGKGTVKTAHGLMPVPAPATLEIISGKPAKSDGITGELTTPTGAAILTTLSKSFGKLPDMIIQAIGYGYGSNKLSIPNFVRVLYGNRGNL